MRNIFETLVNQLPLEI